MIEIRVTKPETLGSLTRLRIRAGNAPRAPGSLHRARQTEQAAALPDGLSAGRPAMSQENVDVVRARYEQFALGNVSFVPEFGDDFELVTSPENPDAGTYRGPAARQWLLTWAQSFDQFTMEATEITDAGDKVLVDVLQRARPHGSETMMESRWWQVLTFRGSELVRSEMFADRAPALEAAGLAE